MRGTVVTDDCEAFAGGARADNCFVYLGFDPAMLPLSALQKALNAGVGSLAARQR